MIVRRRTWVYLPVGSNKARNITFKEPVTKRQVEHAIINQFKQLPQKIWPAR